MRLALVLVLGLLGCAPESQVANIDQWRAGWATCTRLELGYPSVVRVVDGKVVAHCGGYEVAFRVQ